MSEGYEMGTRGTRPSMFSSTSPSAWLPTWRGREQYAALPSGVSDPYTAGRPKAGSPKKRLLQGAAVIVGALFVLALLRDNRSTKGKEIAVDASDTTDIDPSARPANWGQAEADGWTETDIEGLVDLGDIAEQRYRLSFDATEEGVKTYYRQLHEFAAAMSPSVSTPLLSSIYNHLPGYLSGFLPEPATPHLLGPPSMISYKTIHQTDKSKERINDETKAWVEMNAKDGWRLNFFDDQDAWDWVQRIFPRTDVEWAWTYMHRGVLRADFLRYLLPLIEGGVYSDVDTRPIRPIEQWGHLNVEVLDLTSIDGSDWRKSLATHPAVVVGIDVNVHAMLDWHRGWPRAVGICQWTLSGAPHHPIYIDAARRVVNATRVVETWDREQAVKIAELERDRPDGWEKQVQELKGMKKDHAMNVMEWTGPGLFSDAVMAFLLARYNVTWHRLRGLQHPLRIGDVLILPITAFSPGGQPDFASGPWDSPQADVLHNFRGSWKGEGS